jgi:CYTH domain-containing protein
METSIYEIERKFLLKEFPACVFDMQSKGMYIRQGWLTGDKLNLRLRESVVNNDRPIKYENEILIDYLGFELHYFWGVKVGQGVKRIELEDQITKQRFDELWKDTKGKRVYKWRYHVPAENKLKWEVDNFEDRTLSLAEIEMPNEDYNLTIPAWLQPYIVREVTNEPEYNNIALAR